MTPPNELYKWLPADERLARLLNEGKQVFVRNKVADPFLTQPYRRPDTLEKLVSYQYEYLPPTAPEVKELPDCEGWWWVWDDNRKIWDERYIEMKDGKPHDIGRLVRKSYCIKIQKPDFNPVTGEKL